MAFLLITLSLPGLLATLNLHKDVAFGRERAVQGDYSEVNRLIL
jgi:hypothetical protein